jgi:hypothetical protein
LTRIRLCPAEGISFRPSSTPYDSEGDELRWTAITPSAGKAVFSRTGITAGARYYLLMGPAEYGKTGSYSLKITFGIR